MARRVPRLLCPELGRSWLAAHSWAPAELARSPAFSGAPTGLALAALPAGKMRALAAHAAAAFLLLLRFCLRRCRSWRFSRSGGRRPRDGATPGGEEVGLPVFHVRGAPGGRTREARRRSGCLQPRQLSTVVVSAAHCCTLSLSLLQAFSVGRERGRWHVIHSIYSKQRALGTAGATEVLSVTPQQLFGSLLGEHGDGAAVGTRRCLSF